MATQPTYMHDIRSVRDLNPDVPAVVGNVDLGRRIIAGENVNRADLDNARAAVVALKSLNGLDHPAITNEVVESAMLRVRVVEMAYGVSLYSPGVVLERDNLDLVIGNHLELLEQHSMALAQNSAVLNWNSEALSRHSAVVTRNLTTIASNSTIIAEQSNVLADHRAVIRHLIAENFNVHIRARNARQQDGAHNQLRPLRKTRLGNGLRALRGLLDPLAIITFPIDQPPASIRTIPANFSPNIYNYNDTDIFNLILFYNDSFEIRPDDNLRVRINKFWQFLTGL